MDKRMITLMVLLAGATLVWAQPEDRNIQRGPHRGPDLGIVRIADADGDGAISDEEWQSFLAELVSDENGEVDAQSMHAFLESHRPMRPEKGGHGRPDHGARPRDSDDRGPDRKPEHRQSDRHPEGERAFPLDHNGNGILEISDLNNIFSELDTNGDGVLQAEEIPRPPPPPPRRAPKRNER